MLIEIWERLRGYDKWVETEAIIQSIVTKKIQVSTHFLLFRRPQPIYELWTIFSACYSDQLDGRYTISFRVTELSPMFQMLEGETFAIRYKRANSNQSYFRGMRNARPPSATALVLFSAAGIVARLAFFSLFAVELYEKLRRMIH